MLDVVSHSSSSKQRSLRSIKKAVFSLLLLASSVNIYAVSVQHTMLETLSKPLLMPLLILYFYVAFTPYISKKGKNLFYSAIIAFVFSWFGDVLLLFSSTSFIFFIAGIACFLVTQILYVIIFQRSTFQRIEKKSIIKYAIPFLVYVIGFYSILWNELDLVLKIAVLIYAIALGSMGFSALSRWKRSNKESFWLILIGGMLFIFSDSCIAYSKFIDPFELSGLTIMLTYIIAQVLIMLGIKSFWIATS